uniref:Calponin-homology (CH) domain-containing protein n=1 Tax=Aotus nancymaae TaxID=37293 RepID=A0A2K5BXW5_AOTNA
PSYGLSAKVKKKIASKQKKIFTIIEEVTGMSTGPNFQLGLKDGIILCKLINKLQSGSVKKTIVAVAGLAKTEGFHTTIDIGVKYAEKQTRCFDVGKLKAGQSVIGLQMGTNKCASQAGMTAYGTRRHLYDPKMETDKPFDQTAISMQIGTNKGASPAGMLAPGTRRDMYDQKLTLQPVDNKTIYLQMGTNKVASQKGMSVYGLGHQGTGTNGSVISDSDYQAEYSDEYHGKYQDDYPRDYPYSDQGIDD